jgi:hypothetical protein
VALRTFTLQRQHATAWPASWYAVDHRTDSPLAYSSLLALRSSAAIVPGPPKALTRIVRLLARSWPNLSGLQSRSVRYSLLRIAATYRRDEAPLYCPDRVNGSVRLA